MAALAQTKVTATQERLATLDLETKGWSAAVRANAVSRVHAMGLPGRRDEYWKYTDPTTLCTCLLYTSPSPRDS